MKTLRSPVVAAGIAVALILTVTSVILGRADVLVVALTLITAVGVAASKPRAAAGSARIAMGKRHAGRVDAEIHVQTAADTDFATLRLTAMGSELRRVTLASGARDVRVDIPVLHTGDQELLAVTFREASADAVRVSGPADEVASRIVVEPVAVDLRSLPLPSRLRGLTGTHDSSRPGDGGEFRDIHPFVAGDRLRRIDWKATARLTRSPGDLFVRRTHATSDAHVAIVIDDDTDVGERVSTWPFGDPAVGGNTTLDVAREAAWSLTCGYLDAGDSVSFQVLSRARGSVRRGAGARHRELLRAAIARVSAHPRGFARARTPQVAPGALVFVLSPFLDDDPGHLAQLWRAAGHRVIAVDTLPRLITDDLSRERLTALRVVLGRRDDRLHDLFAVGADRLRWDADAESRLTALRALTRQRRRP
ncbi:DUF58 domain-containing protein [Planctomonas sp. JC2975]|uniref:DUF58 domain-containing protein n=1 Tax=Planctomonas sp. JC2975 TaxID=2729626 RepID=UPI00147488F0|nr:DUF58 domain-containing protein [Planctomonas sp. JC2975]